MPSERGYTRNNLSGNHTVTKRQSIVSPFSSDNGLRASVI